MTRQDYFHMSKIRVHNQIPCPCGKKMIQRHHLCDSCYQVTKFQTERLISGYREKTGNKFPVGEVKFEFEDDKLEPVKEGIVMESPLQSKSREKVGNETVKVDGSRPKGWFHVKLW